MLVLHYCSWRRAHQPQITRTMHCHSNIYMSSAHVYTTWILGELVYCCCSTRHHACTTYGLRDVMFTPEEGGTILHPATPTMMHTHTSAAKGNTKPIQRCTSSPSLYNYVFCCSAQQLGTLTDCLLYTSPSPRDLSTSRMPSSA